MPQCCLRRKLVDVYEYACHIVSYLAGSVTSVIPRQSPSNYSHLATVSPGHSAPSRSGTHNQPRQAEHASQPTLVERSVPQNAFQTWLENYPRDVAKSTIIDGEKRNPDMEVRQDAGILRGTTKEEIINIVTDFKGLSKRNRETCLELVRKTPIFPGLVAYTYTHVIKCLDDALVSFQVSSLRGWVGFWANLDDSSCILLCEIVKNELLHIIHTTPVRSKRHRCNPALLNGTTVLKHDILNLSALAALCITGEGIKNMVGDKSNKFVGILHALLESNVELEECYRRCFLNIAIPFGREYGWCPDAFRITGGAISDLERKSEGGFGTVYRGKFGSRLVAVKVLMRSKSTNSQDYAKFISKEAIVWWYLRHPNCLPLYGIYDSLVTEGPDRDTALVSPWMEQGTLSDYLKRFPSANRTKLILDVVRGLNYLHTMKPHVAHRDIKPDNILITRNGNACLADFGLASTDDFRSRRASVVGVGGTPHYMAPELFIAEINEKKRRVNERACDMYALGCTIYETYTQKRPFCEMSLEDLTVSVASGQRPEFPECKIPHDMWCFVERLWHSEPSKRLTAEMALDWMKVRASQAGLDPSLEPVVEEEWAQERSHHLWSTLQRVRY